MSFYLDGPRDHLKGGLASGAAVSDPPVHDAATNLAARPETEPLSDVEVVPSMVVAYPHRDQDLISRAQRRLVIPPDLGRKVPRRAAAGPKGISQNH